MILGRRLFLGCMYNYVGCFLGSGSCFKFWGNYLGYGVLGMGFWVWGFGYGVLGMGFWAIPISIMLDIVAYSIRNAILVGCPNKAK